MISTSTGGSCPHQAGTSYQGCVFCRMTDMEAALAAAEAHRVWDHNIIAAQERKLADLKDAKSAAETALAEARAEVERHRTLIEEYAQTEAHNIAQARAEGRREGLEAAADLMDEEFPTSMFRGKAQTFGDAIRALAAREPIKEKANE